MQCLLDTIVARVLRCLVHDGLLIPLCGAALASILKLVFARVGTVTPHGNSWVDLAPGQYVQGCLTTKGVYAVVEGRVRLV